MLLVEIWTAVTQLLSVYLVDITESESSKYQ